MRWTNSVIRSWAASVTLFWAGIAVTGEIDFARDIQPLFAARCVECHGVKDAVEGGLDLTDARSVLLRGDSGDLAIVPGDTAASELWNRITSRDDDVRMPPDGEALSASERNLIRQWIEEGAAWPQADAPSHWAYKVPEFHAVPGDASAWSRNAIDRFVLAKMRARDLTPALDAEPARMLRRLYIDLIGVPPSVDEVNRFVADPSDQHYEAIVERLLASPRYGEKWSRHWLDLARYSDSNGYQADQIREMWAFRDWVIDALNFDMPYDQFTVEQLAGDLLPNATESQQVATGFHRATTCNVEAGVDPEGNRTDQVIDRVNTTGTTWLATTLECAQCHNHKYDPISQQEYYELFAFFNNTPIEVEQEKKDSVQFNFYGPKLPLPQPEAEQRRFAELQSQLKNVASQIASVSSNDKAEKDKQRLKSLRNKEAALKKERDALRPPTTLVMREMQATRETAILVRGDFLSPGAKVRPNVPRVLNELPTTSSVRNRLTLARWIVAPENPLTARVAVNRWWYELFGRGIVETVGDFGTQGSAPTHPELLDWLAIQLRKHDWSMKAVHRMMVLSSTYRQSARAGLKKRSSDPSNVWLARGPRNRLPAELIRDHALSVSGLLVDAMRGPPVYPPQPAGLWKQTGRNEPVFQTALDQDRFRRGSYVVWRRAAPYPTFTTFDAPDRMTCVASRPKTNTPLQALALLNDKVYTEAALALAARVLCDGAGRGVDSKLEYAVKLVISRAPTADEVNVLRRLLKTERQALQEYPERVNHLLSESRMLRVPAPNSRVEWAAWFCVCNALLNLDEAISK